MRTRNRFRQRCLTMLIIVFLSTAASGCASNPRVSQKPVSRTGFAFDTIVTITLYHSDKEHVLDHCLALCESYEALFSVTQENSDLWKINHSNGQATAVSYETAVLLQAALQYCAQSQGALDLTLYPVSDEWDISGQMKQASLADDYTYYIPTEAALSELLAHVNYKNVLLTDENGTEIGYDTILSENTAYFVTLQDPQSAIDLGFIAKGYIADQLKTYLLSCGVESAIISLGGNILLVGTKPDGSPFNVGIQKPFGAVNEVLTTLQKSDISVVSSGCYERYFITDTTGNQKDRTIYHHILDTTTGYPVQNDLLGVTVLSDSSMRGDALSTYCYILGLEKGLDYIRSHEDVEAVFVTKDNKIITSY